MHFPRIEIINEELRIGACNAEDIPEYLEQELPRENITVLYWYKKDWIVLNKENSHYDVYKSLLTDYLQMTNEGRKKLNEYAKTLQMTFFGFVNQALRIRRKRHKAKRKE